MYFPPMDLSIFSTSYIIHGDTRDWLLYDFVLTLIYNVPYSVYPIMVHVSP
jgi:hypothetical protein